MHMLEAIFLYLVHVSLPSISVFVFRSVSFVIVFMFFHQIYDFGVQRLTFIFNFERKILANGQVFSSRIPQDIAFIFYLQIIFFHLLCNVLISFLINHNFEAWRKYSKRWCFSWPFYSFLFLFYLYFLPISWNPRLLSGVFNIT